MTEAEDDLAGARDLVWDEANEQLLMLYVDPGQSTNTTIRSGRILAIDVYSGARQLVSSNASPEGEPEFFMSYSLAFDQAGGQLFLLQRNDVVGIDPVSGQRSPLYNQTGLRGRIGAVDSAGNSLFVIRQDERINSSSLIEFDIEMEEMITHPANGLTVTQGGDLVYDEWEQRLLYTSRGHIGVFDLDSGELENWLF